MTDLRAIADRVQIKALRGEAVGREAIRAVAEDNGITVSPNGPTERNGGGVT